MADAKTPLERLVEAAVFAPLGIAAMVRDELPKLVERGHQEANTAKMIGQLAVNMARSDLEKRLKRVVERPTSAPPAATPSAPPAAPDVAEALEVAAAVAPPTLARRAGRAAGNNGRSVRMHDAQSLAIPGYDSLSASQVVERLAGLNAEELDAIASYEAAGRGRRTILNRVAQLRGV